MSYRTYSHHCKEKFGCKVYKLSIDAGFTCPNRDGTCGVGGCIFCSGRGSGDFAEGGGSVTAQLERAKSRFPGLQGEVVAINNDFFGHTIDVAGLLTGQDIAAQLKGRVEGRVLIPLHMLRHGENVFLDDYTVERLSEELGVPVQVVGIDGGDLADAMFEATY